MSMVLPCICQNSVVLFAVCTFAAVSVDTQSHLCQPLWQAPNSQALPQQLKAVLQPNPLLGHAPMCCQMSVQLIAWYAITGDSSTTACAIARECGILSSDEQPILGLPDDLQPLSATRSTMDSTLSSVDEPSSPPSDSPHRSHSGSHASTSSSSDSQDTASTALATPAKAVLGNGHASSNGVSASPSSPQSSTGTATTWALM